MVVAGTALDIELDYPYICRNKNYKGITMIDISKIDGYQDIEEIRRVTEERKVEVDLQHKLEPYNQVYSRIHNSKEKGETDCYIDEYWLRDRAVKEFFINQGYTMDEPFTANEITSHGTSTSTTIRLSWAVNKIIMVTNNDNIEDFSREDIERALD